MREILFRGRRIDNGEWVEGAFLNDRDGAFYICPAVSDISYGDGGNRRRIGCWYKVAPSTVGQYTGLTDKNGKRIFEGDILHISKIADGLGGYYQPPIDYSVNVVVKWDLCAWMWETLCEDKRYISFPDAWCHYECEVIGKIHDNPEMLKGGDISENRAD